MALEQALGQHCFRNAQCYSGWCNEGFCARPVNTHHPCNSHRDNCPYNLYCSSFSHTCVTADYVAKSKCSCASDCKYNENCIKGKCKKTKAIGSKCSLYGSDNCETGSMCTFIKSDERDKPKCFELCSANVPCPTGYACVKLKDQSQPLCVPKNAFLMDDMMRYARITGTIMFIAMIMFGLAYAWIKLTKSKKDPRLKNKKRLRLQYEGNGLASITFVASPDQSPAPVAASQLFNSSANTPSVPPPSYDEAVGSLRR